MDPIYGVDQLEKFFVERGANISRAALYKTHLPILKQYGYAKEVAPKRWMFHQPETMHYADYVAEVRKRQADGRLPGNYQYSEWDCTQFREGNIWDE